MRTMLTRIAALGVLTIMLAALTATIAASRRPHEPSGLKAIRYVDQHRRDTWACQDELHLSRFPTSWLERKTVKAGSRWTLAVMWGRRVKLYCRTVHELNANPVNAIRYVFRPTGTETKAVDVAGCETGHTFWVGATNGQYLGLFQMGSGARAACGHGATALRQAWAARCWFNRVGGWVSANAGGWSCA